MNGLIIEINLKCLGQSGLRFWKILTKVNTEQCNNGPVYETPFQDNVWYNWEGQEENIQYLILQDPIPSLGKSGSLIRSEWST